MPNKHRVIAYIDGFNLYYGLKSKSFRRYYWLNLELVVENLLKPNQELKLVKYFTARISIPREKQRRQSVYIEALETLAKLRIFFGKYFIKEITCNNCKTVNYIPNEKMTDVNLATEMLIDAFQQNFDTALLISADSDLVHTVRSIKDLFPNKEIVACFPPGRFSSSLHKLCFPKTFVIGRRTVAKSLLPEMVTKKDGTILMRPAEWK